MIRNVVDQFLIVWNRLDRHWAPYLQKAGLHLAGLNRHNAFKVLTEPIEIDFGLAGLRELARDCHRAIEPGDPGLSLLYYVLASPHVVPVGVMRSNYPTVADLEVVENLIYAASRMTMAKLQQAAGGHELAIVVFAYEYAPLADTVQKCHADLCFSRTGISRVGNADHNYDPRARGFFPYSRASKCVHVVPARFGAFIACRSLGNEDNIGPLRPIHGDEERSFWVPLHKVFPGRDCIVGMNLDLTFEVKHINEKIRKVHLALQSKGMATGWTPSQMEKQPFVISDELAKFSQEQSLLVPIPHDPLIEPGRTEDGRLVGFTVPHRHRIGASALWLKSNLKGHPWPEFVHIRHKIVEDDKGKQSLIYLPDTYPGDIVDALREGGFQAANFIDWTSDGYIKAICPELTRGLDRLQGRSKSLAAYSVVGPPDFFPLVKQQDLADWWRNSPFRKLIWTRGGPTPTPLSGQRIPANITIKGAGFDSSDTTMTAIIGPRRAAPSERCKGYKSRPRRESTLSYRASNLFQPGWDTSEDFGRDHRSPVGTFFMANYGLGSPYPEDALICSALGAYWPGAVPDTARFFSQQQYPSTTPLTDSEANWSGVDRPTILSRKIEFQSIDYADYVRAVYKGNFPFERFAMLSLEEYILRTTITARFFRFLSKYRSLRKMTDMQNRARYVIISFERVGASDLARLVLWTDPVNQTFRIEWAHSQRGPSSLRKKRPQASVSPRTSSTTIGPREAVFIGPVQVAYRTRRGSDKWNVAVL